MQWIDVHTHFNMLEDPPEVALQKAIDAGVHRMITIGTSLKDLALVIDIAEKLSPHVYCTLGVHPHDAESYNQEAEEFIVKNLSHERVVALGEMGLDYFYDHADREVQKNVFRRQLEIAIEHDLPVQIHTRDAEDDTIDILKSFGGKAKGILHCFTSSQKLADAALELGLNISISGVVTFKNADSLRAVVKSIPMDRIHVETDAPFLAPMPQRGKKNQPAFVAHTGQFVAELKAVDVEEFAKITNENALKMFKKINWNN